MKRIVLVLFAGITLVPAIEWEIIQITFDQEANHVTPQIAVSNDGYARIVYGEVNEQQGEAWLGLASQTSEGWDVVKLVELSEFFANDYGVFLHYQTFSLDLDISGEAHVVYIDFEFEEAEENWITNLFLASAEQDGLIDTSRLTQDTFLQYSPVVRTNGNGKVNVTYQEFENYDSYAPYINCGWFEDDSFCSMLVTKMAFQTDEIFPTDMVLDEDGNPYIFFTGFDACLWCAVPFLTDSSMEWDIERLSNSLALCPSAVFEPSGGSITFHVTFNAGEEIDSICYCTNKTGEWETEYVGQGISYWWLFPMTSPVGLNYLGHPSIIWPGTDGEIHCSEKTPTGWRQDLVELPTDELLLSYGRYFDISEDGYGHLVYSAADAEDIYQIYYARTKDPLKIGIAEYPTRSPQSISLEVHGRFVSFSLAETMNISLVLYDACGRRVKRLASGTFTEGEHFVPINTSGLSSGVYFILVEVVGQSSSAKFVLMR